MPAFRNCRASPEPGCTTNTTRVDDMPHVRLALARRPPSRRRRRRTRPRGRGRRRGDARREAAELAGRRERADEDAGVVGIGRDARAVAEERAPGAQLDGIDRERRPPSAPDRSQAPVPRRDERALAHPGRPRHADAAAPLGPAARPARQERRAIAARACERRSSDQVQRAGDGRALARRARGTRGIAAPSASRARAAFVGRCDHGHVVQPHEIVHDRASSSKSFGRVDLRRAAPRAGPASASGMMPPTTTGNLCGPAACAQGLSTIAGTSSCASRSGLRARPGERPPSTALATICAG